MTTDLRRRGAPRASEPEGPSGLAVLRRLRPTAAPAQRPAGGPGPRSWVQGESTPAFVLLAATTATLVVLGLVMAFSASFVRSTGETGDAFGLFLKQLLVCAAGVLPLALLAATDYRRLRPFALPLLAVTLLACALVLVPGIGSEVNGARRWFDFGFVSLQPSELLKVALPLALSHQVARRWTHIRRGDLRALLLPAIPILVVAGGLVVAGPDLETALLVVAIGGVVLYVAGLPGRIIALGLGAGLLVGVLGIASSAMRRARVLAWLDPTSDPSNTGYQILQGWIALGSGGLFGVGLGASRSKWGYVPNADTDYIFAIIGEELGLVGALTVLLLFVGIAVGGTVAARRAPDPFGRLLATSITAWLLLQAGINIGSVVGLLPVTGVTLPLVSYGGSSLLFTMVGVGILLSVARAGRPGPADGEREAQG
jgi:cell division protein FtsW